MRPMPTTIVRANQGKLMGHQLPSSRFETGLISTDGPILLASISVADGTPADSCSMQPSIPHTQLLQPKGLEMLEYLQPSTLSTPIVFSLHCSSFFSFTYRTFESVSCSSPLHPLESSESSFQKLRELQWHHRQSEVRNTLLQSMALRANEFEWHQPTNLSHQRRLLHLGHAFLA
jgi:hypothetical protein